MERVGCVEPSTMHYGEEKSRDDFGNEDIGLVNGCIDSGDEFVINVLAEPDCDARPEAVDDGDGESHRAHGRGFEGPDAEVASAVLGSVRENHTAQAAGRYARNADDPDDTATVFVRTDALPVGFADVQVPGVTWTYARTQREIIETLRSASRPLSTRELSSTVGCSKEHVRETLSRFTAAEDNNGRSGVQAFPKHGEHGAILYSLDGVPNQCVVDLGGVTTNDPVWGSYTWSLAVSDPELQRERDDPDPANKPTASQQPRSVWDWRSAQPPTE